MQIDVFADFSCPWSYLGILRLDEALREVPDRDSYVVRYRPLQMDPDLPPIPQPFLRYYGERGALEGTGRHAVLDVLRATPGVRLRLQRAVVANTMRAHRLVWIAGRDGGPQVQRQIVMGLMHACFTESANIADLDTLTTLAHRAGLDRCDTRMALIRGDSSVPVQRAIAMARARRITEPPTFVADGRFMLRGPQEPDALRRLLTVSRTAAA
jgi:predicted DsbA family dithiol-disulfide isomerase